MCVSTCQVDDVLCFIFYYHEADFQNSEDSQFLKSSVLLINYYPLAVGKKSAETTALAIVDGGTSRYKLHFRGVSS